MTTTYKNATSNCPELCSFEIGAGFGTYRPELKPWDAPHWEIMVGHDGGVEVYALRPSESEMRNGDLFGRFGSTIHMKQVNRSTIKRAIRLARVLGKCDPINGVVVSEETISGLGVIETDIPVYVAERLAA